LCVVIQFGGRVEILANSVADVRQCFLLRGALRPATRQAGTGNAEPFFGFFQLDRIAPTVCRGEISSNSMSGQIGRACSVTTTIYEDACSGRARPTSIAANENHATLLPPRALTSLQCVPPSPKSRCRGSARCRRSAETKSRAEQICSDRTWPA